MRKAQPQGIEGVGLAKVALSVDGGKPDQFARQVKTERLFAAFTIDAPGLDGPLADRRNRVERLALSKNMRTRWQRPDVLHEHMQVAQLALVHPLGEAGLRKRAG